jgi:hypothetical protein
MMDDEKKVATNTLVRMLHKFYEGLTQDLTREELQALNARIREEAGFPSELGSEVTKAVFNFVCPDTGSLISATGFNAHGNLNYDTGAIEAIITVDCTVCGKEHPVTVISFPEMMSMPLFDDDDTN